MVKRRASSPALIPGRTVVRFIIVTGIVESSHHSEYPGLSYVLAARFQDQSLSHLYSFPFVLGGRDFSRAPWGLQDTESLEWRAALGAAAGPCGRRLRDMDSLDGVRSSELGGSESGLEGTMVRARGGVRKSQRSRRESGVVLKCRELRLIFGKEHPYSHNQSTLIRLGVALSLATRFIRG